MDRKKQGWHHGIGSAPEGRKSPLFQKGVQTFLIHRQGISLRDSYHAYDIQDGEMAGEELISEPL